MWAELELSFFSLLNWVVMGLGITRYSVPGFRVWFFVSGMMLHYIIVDCVRFLFSGHNSGTIQIHHYNWTAQAYCCCLDHWMTGCGFIPLRWEEWYFFQNDILEIQSLTIMTNGRPLWIFLPFLSIQVQISKPVLFKHSIQSEYVHSMYFFVFLKFITGWLHRSTPLLKK